MASTIDKIKNDIIEAMNASQKKTSAYDTEAEIVRVDGNTAWVHIAGGVSETPVALTINAKKGDKVQVRVSNGGAWLVGNATAPPTDDAKANEADKKAAEAKYLAVDAVDAALKADIAAQDAVSSAETARTAAETAQEIAESVEDIAVQAQEDATAAQGSATSARESAIKALTELSTVEDVIGTLNWVQQHGYYALSQDTTVTANKVYYTITATAVQSPTGNPSMNGYYERSGAGTEADPYIYALSTDTTVDSQKTYYTVNATTVANPTGNPNENLYYDLLFDTAMSQYVNTHLALTDAGLSVMNNNSSGSMLLSTEGVTIKNAQGVTVGKYGEGATIGALDSQHISMVNGQINFWAGTESIQENLVAYVSGQELHIPRVVVVQSLQMGNWKWDATLEGHLSLNWIG